MLVKRRKQLVEKMLGWKSIWSRKIYGQKNLGQKKFKWCWCVMVGWWCGPTDNLVTQTWVEVELD